MCTVTFIPVRDSCFITSNRDEKMARKDAIPPEIYAEAENRIIYPKDAEAGGSWIAMNDHGKAAVLLNGAFVKHEPEKSYRKSRGIIFLEIFNHALPVNHFLSLNLAGIEPFTMIILDNSLYECRWTGLIKHCRQLAKDQSYIWSSATLYDEEVVIKREYWFKAFKNKSKHPSQDDILDFHRFTGDGDEANDLHMNRNGLLSTVSITGIVLEPGSCKMKYLDLKNNITHLKEMKQVSSLHDEVIN